MTGSNGTGHGLQTWTVACSASGLLTANAPGPRGLTPDELSAVENIASTRLDFLRQMDDRRRNVRAECGVPERMPDALSFLRLYEEDGLAGAVVERYPQETFKVAGEVWDAEEEDEDTPFEAAWDALGSAVRGQGYAGAESEYEDDGESNPLWRLMMDWDVASRVAGCGYMLVGVDDGRDLREPAAGVEERNSSTDEFEYRYEEAFGSYRGDEFEGQVGWPNVPRGARRVRYVTTNEGSGSGTTRKPITRNAARRHRPYSLTWNAQDDYSGRKARRLLYARAFTSAHVTPVRWERNRSSPRYGQPTHYHFDFGDPLRGSAYLGPADTAEVHWTRVLPLASDARFRAAVYEGVSALWPVYPEIYNVQKVKGASGEGYWRSGIPRTVLKTPSAIAGAPRTVVRRQVVRDEWEKLENSLDKMAIVENLEPVQINPQLVDPTPHVDLNLKLISVALNMPRRKLEGSERGELASSEDEGDWNDVVRARQRNRTVPHQVVPLVDRFRGLGLLPPPRGGKYKCGWPAVDALSKLEKSQVFASDMAALGTYVEKGVNQFMSEHDVAVRYLDVSADEAEAMLESAAQAETDRHETDLEKQVSEQRTMIDEGLAPDPTAKPDPEPITVKPGDKLIDHPSKAKPGMRPKTLAQGNPLPKKPSPFGKGRPGAKKAVKK